MDTHILWDLQEKEQELDRIKEELKQRELADILREEKKKIEPLKKSYERKRTKLRDREGEIQSSEENLQDLVSIQKTKEEELYDDSSRDSRELEIMQTSVETNKAEIAQGEEDILEHLEKIEKNKENMQKEGEKIQALIKEYQENLKAYRKNKEYFTKKKIEKEKEIEKLTKKLTPHLLKEYKHVQSNYDNTGIAKIENDTCTGCRIGMSILHLKEISNPNVLYYCENCQRILVIDEVVEETEEKAE